MTWCLIKHWDNFTFIDWPLGFCYDLYGFGSAFLWMFCFYVSGKWLGVNSWIPELQGASLGWVVMNI
jgi:hypothetical protein